ncbi:ISL3 family transposase, partial [Lentilactobacillus buchneri]|nr:ISL3 family transposase [Lentilactobacillus buchneri]
MSDDPFVVYAIERHTKMSTDDKKARHEIFRALQYLLLVIDFYLLLMTDFLFFIRIKKAD